MTRRRSAGCCIGILVVTAPFFLVTACRIEPFYPDDVPQRLSLEIVNDASDRVRVRIGDATGILDLDAKEGRTVEVAAPGWVGPPVSEYVRYLPLPPGIDFFDASAATPHRRYSYYNFDCIDATGESGDDTQCAYARADGAEDRLFVEVPDRPFYLERDTASPERGRVVITYVPRGESLEVINESGNRIRIQIAMRDDASFLVPSGAGTDYYAYGHSSGILDLDGDGRTTLAMSSGVGPRDSLVNVRYVRLFADLHFYRDGAHTPYRSYVYDTWWCGPDFADDTSCVYYRRADGAADRLFVKSPDRPFYLERDDVDLDLARLVITFEPTVQGKRPAGFEVRSGHRGY